MEKTESKQSVVRTDFTLKYYQLEELLNKHSKLKVTGAESNIFVRSWIDYSLVRGDNIIHWRKGSFADLLVVISDFFNQSFDDVDALIAFFKGNEKYRAVIFVVSTASVPAQDLKTLLSLLESLQYGSESNAIDNELSASEPEAVDCESEEDLDVSSQNPLIDKKGFAKPFSSKVVLCITTKDSALSGYSSILQSFATAFELGGENQEKAGKESKISILVALVLLAGAGVGYWFNFSEKVEPLVEEIQVSISENMPIKEILNDAKLTSISSVNQEPKSDDVNSLVEQAKTEQSVVATDIKKETVTQELVENSEKSQPAQPEIVATPESLREKAVKNINADLTQENGPVILPDHSSKKQLEQVSIVDVSSAKVINIGSSINTLSSSQESVTSIGEVSAKSVGSRNTDQEITKIVDAWMNAWQSQNFANYSQFYSENFKGKQSTHKKWLTWRKKRIEKPAWIKLSRSNIKRLSKELNVYSVSLTLSYASPRYKDKTFKRMTFDQSSLGYKITKEENLKVTKLK
ncbi:MAG: hypothetical protein V7784_09305 [Oceanospirillaceae bacterium]